MPSTFKHFAISVAVFTSSWILYEGVRKIIGLGGASLDQLIVFNLILGLITGSIWHLWIGRRASASTNTESFLFAIVYVPIGLLFLFDDPTRLSNIIEAAVVVLLGVLTGAIAKSLQVGMAEA